MATALEIISGALKLLGVTDSEGPIEAQEAQDGLTSLNDMMSGWEEKQIYTGFVPIVDVDDIVYVPDSIIGGMKSNLAVYIAPEYDRVVSPSLERRKRDDYRDIRANFVRIRPSKYPDTLPRGSGNKLYNTSSDGDVPNTGIDDTFYPENEKRNF